MPRVEKEIVIKSPQGLHARPAALFVQRASKYNAKVRIRKDSEEVDGKSIMGILTLGAQQNSKITLCVEGEDAPQAFNELETLLTKETL